MRHAPHTDVLNRLKRVEGHLRSVITMIQSGRNCVELAQQLAAVEKAVGAAKRTLVQSHLEHCLEDAVEDGRGAEALEEARKISRFL